ncbi:uncharacterized protein [Diabrotica undecimpunctata]|uniref:uncharacterized protein n=1 Tax=Diabrotica undecimpunctata TaxID=50387 RepID=UPI003B6408B4
MFILVIILVLILIYYYLLKPLTFWQEIGVIQEDLHAAFTFNWFFMFRKHTLAEILSLMYKKFPDCRYYGTYQFNIPTLILKDVDLVKQITIKDFDHFSEHRNMADEVADPLWATNLFSLKGAKWRRMRSILSPSFTSSKLKLMFPLINENSQKVTDYFLSKDTDIVEIEMKEVATKYCTDVIASTAFGLEVNSLADPDNEFYINGGKLANLNNFRKIVSLLINLFFPNIAKLFNIRIVNVDVGETLKNIIDDTIKFRQEKGISRPDMIQMLLEARKKLPDDDKTNENKNNGNEVDKPLEITNQDILAQALIFFFAGFDTSSGFISLMGYELCTNQAVQEKLRQEVIETFDKCQNGLTYDALADMKYMDMVISEALRKWPNMPAVERVCTKPLTIPPVLPHEKPLHIKVGQLITILSYGIHHDPRYYPNPEVFDPERFNVENKGDIKGTYIPFGLGPRSCIGARFALMETKLFFLYILKNFKIVPTNKTDIPLVLSAISFVSKNGFHMGLKRIYCKSALIDVYKGIHFCLAGLIYDPLLARSLVITITQIPGTMFWILVAVLLATLFYYFCYKPATYWRERGVRQVDFPNVLIDNYFGVFKRVPLVNFISELYNRFPGTRYNGIYQFNRPALLVTDVDLIKQMLIKDFEHFNEHRDFSSEENDPLWSKNLFSLKGNKWRNMRSTLSPSFTSSKMKGMLYLIINVADKFTKYFLSQDKDLIEVEMKELASRYGTDVIASTAFGLEVDSLENPNNEFFLKGKEFLDLRNFKVMARFIIVMFFPRIAKFFNIKFLSMSIQNFFTKIIQDTIKLREEKGLIRPDMIHLLLEAKKGNTHSEDHNIVDAGYATVEEHLKADKNAEITEDDIIAQAFVFFFAGFDSSSTLISFLAYELCANQDIQEKLRDEIKDTLDSCNGKLNYEALVNMKYMDMVVTETLRKWPVQVAIERVCTKPYTIEPSSPDETPVHFEIGSSMIVPTYGIHHDPDNFADPETFNPERFSEENKADIKPSAFQPFGVGPRNCIGSRFAILETKVLFFFILKHFSIVPTEKTVIPVKMVNNVFSIMPKDGFNMGFKRI